jgi:hypothetical protein
MFKNSKLIKTFLVFVCVPALVFIVNGSLANNTRSWSWHNLNSVNFVANLLALLGSIYTMYVNYKTHYNSNFWYILLILLVFWFLSNLILIQIGSNFGF